MNGIIYLQKEIYKITLKLHRKEISLGTWASLYFDACYKAKQINN